MDDNEVMGRIDQLVAEEQALYERESHGRLEAGDHELRQRRAHREFGLDPDDARARSGETVEGYQQ